MTIYWLTLFKDRTYFIFQYYWGMKDKNNVTATHLTWRIIHIQQDVFILLLFKLNIEQAVTKPTSKNYWNPPVLYPPHRPSVSGFLNFRNLQSEPPKGDDSQVGGGGRAYNKTWLNECNIIIFWK